LCHGGIQFNQHVTSADLLSIGDMNGFDGGSFKRLDGFGAVIRHHLALGSGHHFDLAENGPQ
jgi:hypothetical protein